MNSELRRPLILGSASPRRNELLSCIPGISFRVIPSTAEEPELDLVEDPGLAARSLARIKAEAVLREHRGAAVLGADTIVFTKEESQIWRVLGKPKDSSHAREMLTSLSGACHLVVTGFCLLGDEPVLDEEESVETKVWFSALSEGDISSYLETNEAYDKAGAYGIQGAAKLFIPRIEGSYTNVVGLPVVEVRSMLRRCGLLVE